MKMIATAFLHALAAVALLAAPAAAQTDADRAQEQRLQGDAESVLNRGVVCNVDFDVSTRTALSACADGGESLADKQATTAVVTKDASLWTV